MRRGDATICTTTASRCSAASFGTVSLATSVIEVGEAAGSVGVKLRRQNGTDGRVTVDYRTFAGTATAGQDYTTTSGTVTFEAGESEKTVLVPILNDTAAEPAETFTFTIDNVTGGAALGAPRTATVTMSAPEAS